MPDRLKFDNAINAELERIQTEEANELEFHVGSDKSAMVEFHRTWKNGWGVTAYARAWYHGDTIVKSGGASVKKTF